MNGNLSNPFKGLQSYSRADSERLFGRDRDLILMKDRIFSARTTLLFAGSGVGKTSFLNAKIIPELEDQYCTFYHNRWADPSEPLDAVKNTLAERIEAAKKDGPLIDSFQQFNSALAPTATQLPSDGKGFSPRGQCLLIFDQFEEIFQYHSYEDYFKRFLSELCEVVRRDEYRVHVVISMREEFLGELSVFDNLIPNLFNNYYRLKYPDTREARRIVEGTCGLADVKVHKDNLTQLIQDLSKIEKGAAGAAERSTRAHEASDHVVERNFIIPPYLQITCHRYWQNQATKTAANDGDFVFLEDYKPGEAQKILREFCQEKLSTLSFMEQNFAAQSFDFLVTKQGAKMAYEFTSLADHMRIRFFRGKLKQALDKLSIPETRILRKSHGPDGSIWFELYHDIYGKILDTWRQSFRQRKQRLGIAIGVATLALLVIIGPVTSHWVVSPRIYKSILREAQLEKREDYAKAEEAYRNLYGTLGYQSTANSLWAQAWERRARYAESHNKRDEALISWLQALSLEPDGTDADRRRLKAGYLTRGSYQQLLANFHHDNQVDEVLFSIDGQIILTKSIDQKMYVWDGRTGEQLGKHSNPPIIRSADKEQVGAGEAAGARPPARPKSARAGNTGARDSSRQGSGKQPEPDAPEQYAPKSVAIHPELGWLIAAMSDRSEGFAGTSEDEDKRRGPKYIELPVSVLSSSGEIPDSSVVVEVLRLSGYARLYANVALSPNGKYIATDGTGQKPRVWQLAGKTFMPAEGFRTAGYIKDVAFSADNRYLMAIGERDSLLVWDVGSGRLLSQPLHIPKITTCRFSADGNTLISVSKLEGELVIKTWETATGKPLATLTIVKQQLYEPTPTVAINSAGAALVFDLGRNTIQSFNARTGEVQENVGAMRRGRLSPNGETMLDIQGRDALLFKIGGQQIEGPTLKADAVIVKTVLSEDGNLIVTLKDAPPPAKRRRAPQLQHSNDIAQAWNAETHAPIGNPIPNVIAISEDGRYAARQGEPKAPVQIVDVQTGNEVMSFSLPKEGMFDLLFASPGGKFFVTVSSPDYSGSKMYVWGQGENSLPSSPVASIERRDPIWYSFRSRPSRDIDKFTITFTPDDRYLTFSSNTSNVIKVWQLSPWQPVALSNNLSGAGALSFNQQGQLIAGGTNVARVWDITSRKSLYNDLEANTEFKAVALSADGTMALAGGEHGIVSLWRFSNELAARVGPEMKHGDNIQSVNFSNDGKNGVIMAGEWLHVINTTNGVYEASYFLGENLLSRCRSMDQTSNNFTCVYQSDDKTLKIGGIQSGQIMGAAPIQGNPLELFSLWQTRLGLRIDKVGQIVPAGLGDLTSSPEANGE